MPIGIVTLIAGAHLIPKQTVAHAGIGQFDLPGAATAIGGLASLMFALGGAAEHGWFSIRTISALAVSAALVTAFFRIETARPMAERPLYRNIGCCGSASSSSPRSGASSTGR